MDALEFNSLYDEKVTSKLIRLGFTKKGHSLFLITDDGILTLVRSSYRGLRLARFMICFRHKFVKDLDGKENNYYSINPNDYPFKVLPKELINLNLSKWHYEPRYVGLGYHYQELNYDITNYDEIEKELNNIYLAVSQCSIEWMNMLSPEEALIQLKMYNQKSATEVDWINDYNNFFISK